MVITTTTMAPASIPTSPLKPNITIPSHAFPHGIGGMQQKYYPHLE
jgi:hypothetical protein